MIVDEVVGLIPRSYKALKNKPFRHKKTNSIPAATVPSQETIYTYGHDGERYI